MDTTDIGDRGAELRARVAAGRSLMATLDVEPASQELQEVVATVPPQEDCAEELALRVEAEVLLAQCYLDLARVDDALDLADLADTKSAALLATSPTDASLVTLYRAARRTLARSHMAVGEHDIAADLYRQLIRTFQADLAGPPSVDGDVKLSQILEEGAQCWLLVGRPAAALDLLSGAATRWRRICRHPSATAEHREKFAWCLQLMARADIELGRPRDAAARLSEADALR